MPDNILGRWDLAVDRLTIIHSTVIHVSWNLPFSYCDSGPLTQAKSRDHEIVRAQKKVSKGRPKHLQNHVV